MAMQAGGWTISWQGTDTKAADFPNGTTIGRAISDAVRATGGQAAIAADGRSDLEADVAIIVMGEAPYAEFEGDVPNLAFRMKPEEEELLARFKARGMKTVLLFLSGRPMFTGKLINQVDSVVAAWLPGTQAAGVSDVLVAGPGNKVSRDFSGRLPFAWPADARSPVSNPLFAEGYGLTYANGGRVGPVNEDPRVDLSTQTHATHFIVRGKSPAPWRLDNDGAISMRAVDLSAQEDARQFSWNRDGMFSIFGPAVDLTKQLEAESALLIDWRVDQMVSGAIKLSFGEAALDISGLVNAGPAATILQTRIPLRCFAEAGAKLNAVGAPLRLAASKGFVATIRNVRIDEAGGAASCPQKAN
jgi:beta-glucosidase